MSLAGCANLLGTDEAETGSTAIELSDLPAEAQSFVTLVNDHRENQGLEPLAWHAAIGGVAQAHSQDMRDRDYFAHDNPDGESPFDRMRAAGISYQGAGENIARGYTTGQSVLNGWLGSTGHRENIENSAYTHHGLRYVEDGNYWTHVFATNPSVD